MKTLYPIIILIIISCSSNYKVEKRINKVLIEEFKNYDTIFALRSQSENYYSHLWFYKNDSIYRYTILPNKTKKFLREKNYVIKISKDSLKKYFIRDNLDGDINCTYNKFYTFGGFQLHLYTKKEKINIGIDIHNCLYKKKFNKNTFPYRLQKELYPILLPSNFDIETMTPTD